MVAAAVTAWVACWWISLAAPLGATSLLPLVLLPLLGALPLKDVALNYANPNIFLFMGGFMIALGIERWGLHRRIALHIVRAVGVGESRIVLGFMIASGLLSMWISNTATTLMMFPIGLAIIRSLPEIATGDESNNRSRFPAALMLGIAYGASIGGVATPIGTPPNISFAGQFESLFPSAPVIGFGQWMLIFLPLSAVMMCVAWLVLTRITCRVGRRAETGGREVIREQLRKLGVMSGPERWMLALFVLTAILWITRRSITLGSFVVPGWSDGLAYLAPTVFNPAYLHDATVALAVAISLFVIRGGRTENGRRVPLLDWSTARKLPWDILLLFGGGFAIAGAFRDTGLSRYVGQSLAILEGASPMLMVAGTSFLMTFLTELTSNTATTEVMLPIIAGASTEALRLNPLLLMLPATISASCAFMLPVATPPNAIVFGTGQVEMRDMVRSGIILNLIGVVAITLTIYLLGRPLLGIAYSLPDWAG